MQRQIYKPSSRLKYFILFEKEIINNMDLIYLRDWKQQQLPGWGDNRTLVWMSRFAQISDLEDLKGVCVCVCAQIRSQKMLIAFHSFDCFSRPLLLSFTLLVSFSQSFFQSLSGIPFSFALLHIETSFRHYSIQPQIMRKKVKNYGSVYVAKLTWNAQI